ncbi:MAG: DNA mismatch repair protein MutS [Myxococcales bacterium]|nr:MAG: DNA mismatch repair protein MutS [Myxococcales bacterium]
MSRKRKSSPRPDDKKQRENRDFRNLAFSELKVLAVDPPTPVPSPPAATVARPPLRIFDEEDEESLFSEAVQGVKKLEARPGPPRPGAPPAGPPREDEDLEAQLELHRLVHGDGEFDITATEEYLEGKVLGIHPRILRRLRRGDYAIQAQIDLHGLKRVEAKAAVQDFFYDCQGKGYRCVLVVHGRGLHSKDQMPVLKESLRSWFERGKGPLGRPVLAFTSARPSDGGLGAMYVLLRKLKG